MRVLLLEDEPEMASALRAALRAHDTVVDHVSSLLEAEEAIAVGHYGAILLDRQVPDGDGLSLIPKLRAQGLSVPVIVLTARGDVDDRICGLDTGADDYIAKPFVMDELLARLRAVMRRPQDMQSEVLTFGRLSFDAASREVRIDGERMESAAPRAPGARSTLAPHWPHGAARRARRGGVRLRRRNSIERARYPCLAPSP